METKSIVKQRAKCLLLCCFLFAACNRDMLPDAAAPLCARANTGAAYMQDFTPVGDEPIGAEVMLTDKRDNTVYRCIKMADGRWWMGENLKYDIEGSVFYNNDTVNLKTYGRLYGWQEAMDAVPENWNLPSDNEWKALEIALGMTQADVDATYWRNSGNVGTQLKLGGNSGMNLLLGGYLGTYGQGSKGYYWTSTESGSLYAWIRQLDSGEAGVFRSNVWNKVLRSSVRFVLQVKETPLYMQDFTPVGDEPVGTEVMLTDKRDNTVYRCIKMADGRWWMGENLKYNIEGSVFYNNDTVNLRTYGRLYGWQEAMDAVPENWNLPSDDEWKVLEMALGMDQAEINAFNNRNSGNVGTQLKLGGNSGMNLLLGGIASHDGPGLRGYYWTSTENGPNAWNRIVYSSEVGVTRNTYHKTNCSSVRFVLQIKETPLYMQDYIPIGDEPIGAEVMLTDKRDNTVYRCIKMADGRWWMGENLKYDIEGSVFYNNDTVNLRTYGRLYGWQEAMDAVPENWNLPSDDEWKVLEMALGMDQAEINAFNNRNSGNVGTQLKLGGNSGMNLLLGGIASYDGPGLRGYYWTSTENGPNAWNRIVYSSEVGVTRNTYYKTNRSSVRCVRNL